MNILETRQCNVQVLRPLIWEDYIPFNREKAHLLEAHLKRRRHLRFEGEASESNVVYDITCGFVE